MFAHLPVMLFTYLSYWNAVTFFLPQALSLPFFIVTFFSASLSLLSPYRCTGWIQWDYLCLWADVLWKNTHHGGMLLLNNKLKSILHSVAHRVSPLLVLTVHLSPSLTICLYQPSVGTNLLYNSLTGKQPCFFSSQKPLCSLFFNHSRHLIQPRSQHLSYSSLTFYPHPSQRGTFMIPREWESFLGSQKIFSNIYLPWMRT